MNIKKFAKQATVLTFTTALLAEAQLKRLRKKRTKAIIRNIRISHIPRHDMLQILNSKK